MKKGYLKLKFRNYIGIVIGFLFIASSLVPVDGYPLESTFDVAPPSPVVSYFPFIVALTSIFASLFLKLTFKNYIGVAVGLLFIALALVPLGGYHLEGAVGITGALWNFMVPAGWFCMVVGVVLLFHKRLRLENKRLAFVMFAAGLLIFPLIRLQNIDYFLGLWRGVTGNFDLESPRWLLASIPFVALTSIFAGLLVLINGRTKSQNHPS